MRFRGYQTDLLADTFLAYAHGARRVLAVLPTGAGKTVVFARAARVWPDETIIVAHRRELIRQASQKLGATPHGIIAPGFPRTKHRIQVASVQTLVRRSVSRFGLIVLDEGHHAVAGTWRTFLDGQPDARVMGVTATPERLDGRGLGDIFDTLIVGPGVPELVLAGYLKPARIFAPPVRVDLSALHTLAGDFNQGELAEVMDRPGVTGDAVEHYARHAAGQPTLAFCASVAHAEHVAEAFRAKGWRSACVHGGLPEQDRDNRIAGLADGRVQVLTSCDLISEGLDVPAVSAVSLLRPTQSLARYLQMVGRGMRPGPGAPHLTVLDHAGNARRHGLPDDPREWTLDGTARKKSATGSVPSVRICPACYIAHPPANVCPECGHMYVVELSKSTGPVQRKGELVEIKASAPPAKEILKAAKSWEDVEAIRIRHGYKPGWTDMVWRYRSRRRVTTLSAAEEFGVADIARLTA